MPSELKESILDKLATLGAILFVTVPIACAVWFGSLELFNPWLTAICAVLIALGLYGAELYILIKTL